MGKPKRIRTQQLTETTCTYNACVNFAQTSKEIGGIKDFHSIYKKGYLKRRLNKEKKESIMRRLKTKGFTGGPLQIEYRGMLEKIANHLWDQVCGPSGLSSEAAIEVIKTHYGLVGTQHLTREKGYKSMQNAIVGITAHYGQNVFNHTIAIRDGWVIDSCILNGSQGGTSNSNGVYKWNGVIKGYDETELLSYFVFDGHP